MRDLSEDELDDLMATMADASAADDVTVREIVDSPQLWWAVQRNIAAQNEAVKSPWPPSNVLFRWLSLSVPSFAVLALVVVYFAGVLTVGDNVLEPSVAENTIQNAVVENVLSEGPVNEIASVSKTGTTRTPATPVRSARLVTTQRNALVTKPRTAPSRGGDEIKSDFIALSYSSNPDSGHLVRVRVPSSMMVNLGLVDSVDKPSSLVDAEVVVGDDGQTHAIRFIRQ
ncbi:MAG: hypothetical protein ABL959_08550 [Pyrinomonadaceae bacterium]